MGVSRRSYAAQRGVSEAALRKAIATGRITTLPDGTIDPDRADANSCCRVWYDNARTALTRHQAQDRQRPSRSRGLGVDQASTEA